MNSVIIKSISFLILFRWAQVLFIENIFISRFLKFEAQPCFVKWILFGKGTWYSNICCFSLFHCEDLLHLEQLPGIGATHLRQMHRCFPVPCPPKLKDNIIYCNILKESHLGMSLQFTHLPQLAARQPLHFLQPRVRCYGLWICWPFTLPKFLQALRILLWGIRGALK